MHLLTTSVVSNVFNIICNQKKRKKKKKKKRNLKKKEIKKRKQKRKQVNKSIKIIRMRLVQICMWLKK